MRHPLAAAMAGIDPPTVLDTTRQLSRHDACRSRAPGGATRAGPARGRVIRARVRLVRSRGRCPGVSRRGA
ncbi:hypothetical protein, partial [Streptomyces mangrovisoli]|uniref:hypothetical protein n=1 Tax=Streptomyces mangrovisoli TaxID=1428628 RepID=UPI0019D06148